MKNNLRKLFILNWKLHNLNPSGFARGSPGHAGAGELFCDHFGGFIGSFFCLDGFSVSPLCWDFGTIFGSSVIPL